MYIYICIYKYIHVYIYIYMNQAPFPCSSNRVSSRRLGKPSAPTRDPKSSFVSCIFLAWPDQRKMQRNCLWQWRWKVRWSSHETWWFSIVMLNYQTVKIWNILELFGRNILMNVFSEGWRPYVLFPWWCKHFQMIGFNLLDWESTLVLRITLGVLMTYSLKQWF